MRLVHRDLQVNRGQRVTLALWARWVQPVRLDLLVRLEQRDNKDLSGQRGQSVRKDPLALKDQRVTLAQLAR